MSALRNLIRRWLGIPTREDMRAIALREIDADAAWRNPSTRSWSTPALRAQSEIEREEAILDGEREDTRD